MAEPDLFEAELSSAGLSSDAVQFWAILGKYGCVGEEESVRFNMVAGQTSMHLRNCDLRLKQSLQRT